MPSVWKNKTILITGGTGSFGSAFTDYLLHHESPRAIRIFSRDEFKQYQMQQAMADKRLRFLLGDVRDRDRLKLALHGVDILVHAAALKHIPAAEYNPFEPVKTNILGTQHVIEACLDAGVSRALLISSDKAAHPINLYGATKLCAERLFVQANVYSASKQTRFSVVRYGNVLGSRGSVVPLFYAQKAKGKLTITDPTMTRFWITLPEACRFVAMVTGRMKGGEIFIPKLPSVKVTDLAHAIAPHARLKTVGVRPGEKLHEELITEEESPRTRSFKNYHVIDPQFPYWKTASRVGPKGTSKRFSYRSDTNSLWLKPQQLKKLLNTYERLGS